jgi:hypothetical protein
MGIKREEMRNFLWLTGDMSPSGSQSRAFSKKENKEIIHIEMMAAKIGGANSALSVRHVLPLTIIRTNPIQEKKEKIGDFLASILSVSRRNMN